MHHFFKCISCTGTSLTTDQNDIGIVAAYMTAEATAQGLGSCILGWLDDDKIRKACGLTQSVRLVITLGYPGEGDKLRTKKRKEMEDLASDIAEDLGLGAVE